MLTKEEKNKIIAEFKTSENDKGSIELQVALLTNDIKNLTNHMNQFPKDFSSKRGLLKKVSQRRKFLRYLEDKNFNAYKDLINRLDIRG
ncbi:MAG: 30S ribosomal protein S15 [candidate division TM6 bacterium GW2011_GWF2_32_72]|nr:MAG: 30S ribosomal protein S15 [candidate division TM6 bacterium GW2011_GWF2_32_72]